MVWNLDWYQSWVAVSVALTAIAFLPYFTKLWKAEDGLNPTLAGWAAWMLSDATIFAAQLSTGYVHGNYSNVGWQNALYVMGPILVFALNMRKGVKLAKQKDGYITWRAAFRDWGLSDTVCLLIVLAAVAAWSIKHDPHYAIYLTVVSTIIGTWAVAWPLRLDPYREEFSSWIWFLAGGICGVIAVKDAIFRLDITNGLPPVLFVGVQVTLVVLTARRYFLGVKRANGAKGVF
jgi:hypothetical protein